MSSSAGIPARSRSLRVPPSLGAASSKPPTTTIPQSPQLAPSYVALFLTNLRLLELDQAPDWPRITVATLTAKDAQQNQKRRIQCVEWALYQLFMLWDPEEAREKLQPFFPPQEPLQSLNLRGALYRSLDQVKKSGILGRDTVLRKTMLDDCKGERLEEVLAIYSGAVLKKLLQESQGSRVQAIAPRLAFENFSYTGERTVLSTLVLAHKVSLRNHLREKDAMRARYKDFADLLDLNQRRVARQHDRVKQLIEDKGAAEVISDKELREIQEIVKNNWSGRDGWLESVLYGDSSMKQQGLLASHFGDIWKRMEEGLLGDISTKSSQKGLLEQLDARTQDQEARLERWRDFSDTLIKVKASSPTKKRQAVPLEQRKFDLGFNKHQDLQLSTVVKGSPQQRECAARQDYTQLLKDMKAEFMETSRPAKGAIISQVARPERRRSSARAVPKAASPEVRPPEIHEPLEGDEEGWSSVSSESKEPPPPPKISTPKKRPRMTSSAQRSVFQRKKMILEDGNVTPSSADEPDSTPFDQPTVNRARSPMRNSALVQETTSSVEEEKSPIPEEPPLTPPALSTPDLVLDTESDMLADQILSSMSAVSPSPKKLRHTLSLAERTRLSMSRNSRSGLPDISDDANTIADPPRLSLRSRPSFAPTRSTSDEGDLHAGLIERTRKSMAGFEAAQQKAQIERRRSIKDAKKRQRESSFFPRVDEEREAVTPMNEELMEGDPDYESVFKSRPKIKTSPAASPTRIREVDEE